MTRPVDDDRQPLTDEDLAVYEGVSSMTLVSHTEQMSGDVFVYECIDPNGSTSYWIAGDCDADPGSFRGAVHEDVGRLPREVSDLLGLTCGAETRTTGEPCRTPVRQFGDRCTAHRQATP